MNPMLNKIDWRKRDTVQQCIHIAEKNRNIRRIIVFGSAASNTCNEYSDIDLCLDIDGTTRELSMFDSVADMSVVCGGDCDIVIYNQLSGKLKDVIDQTGVAVYELS